MARRSGTGDSLRRLGKDGPRIGETPLSLRQVGKIDSVSDSGDGVCRGGIRKAPLDDSRSLIPHLYTPPIQDREPQFSVDFLVRSEVAKPGKRPSQSRLVV